MQSPMLRNIDKQTRRANPSRADKCEALRDAQDDSRLLLDQRVTTS
jgi:hypothetical protein